MADIRFDRADGNGRAPVGADHGAYRPDFGGVADLGPCSMTFDESNLVGIDIVAFIDRTQQIGLRFARRQGNTVGAPGRIDACRNDLGVAAVLFLPGPIGPAQNEDDAAFCAHIACTVIIIGAAEPFRRQHARLRKADKRQRVGKNVDAADDRRIDFAGIQRPHRLIERDQRRRTGGIDRHAGAAETKNVGNTVGNNRKRIAGHKIRTGRRRVLDRQIGMVKAGRPDIDADIFAMQRRNGNIGVFQRAPGQLQQNPLLRVHMHGFALRHAEGCRIESIDAVENTGRKGIGLARIAGNRVPEARKIPAVGRNARDRAYALPQNPKQRLRRIRSRGETCAPYDFNCHIVSNVLAGCKLPC